MEEAKRLKEEKQRKEKEKADSKLKRTSEAFQSFFIPKEKVPKLNDSMNQSLDESGHNFLSNFTIKSDMRLAPLTRKQFVCKDASHLEESMKTQSEKSLYLSKLKGCPEKPRSSKKTWPLEELKNDVVILGTMFLLSFDRIFISKLRFTEDDLPPVDEAKEECQVVSTKPEKTLRPKLFSFAENRRPPYWGTWNKKSLQITGRRPFAVDKVRLIGYIDLN
jgi:chromatin assembly factor 1 subunit A